MADKKAQGTSIWFDAVADGLEDLSVELSLAWDTWTGKWALIPKAGGTAVLAGSLTRSATVGKFSGRIGATATVEIPVGSYYLVCQADNESVDFSDEFAKVALDIIAAGIP